MQAPCDGCSARREGQLSVRRNRSPRLSGSGESGFPRLLPSPQAGFTLVEILLALLILAVGLVGVLVLFPVGIDATRISVETTQATTIARQAKAELFCVNGPDQKTPFQRIVDRARSSTNPEHRWFLPHCDEVLYPHPLDGDAACPGDDDTIDNGPEVRPVLIPGMSVSTGEYSWSITVLYPYN